MKKSQIYLLVFLTTFASCHKRPDYYITNILKIQNNTNYNVEMNIMNKQDYSFVFKEYSIPPMSIFYYDTSIYKYLIVYESNYDYEFNSEGKDRDLPYWDYSVFGVSMYSYNFDNVKLLENQRTKYTGCDTSQNEFPCSFITKDTIANKLEDGNLEYTITNTYYVTNQQFLLADSL